MIDSKEPDPEMDSTDPTGSMDDLLRELGTETPFTVDWEAYERTLMARMARNQRAARWKSWRAAVIGSIAGAAAMFVLSFTIFRPARTAPQTPDRQSPVPQVIRQESNDRTSPKIEESAPEMESSGGSYARLHRDSDGKVSALVCDNYTPAVEPVKPFTRRYQHKDGSVGEIRFEGYSEGNGNPGVIAVTQK